MAFFQALGSKEAQIDALIYDSQTTSQSYTGIKALKNSDVLTAVMIIAGDIARFPIIKQDLDGRITQDEDLNYLMNVKSTKEATAHAWKFAMVVNAILCGNAYSRILRDPKTKKALEFEFYPPSAVSIVEGDDYTSRSYIFYPLQGNREIRCDPEDVIHWKFFSSDAVYGRSPLLSLRNEISLQESGISTLLKFFRDGFSSGILTMKGSQLSGEARKSVRQEFEISREGATGGSPIVMDSTMEYTPLEIDTNVLSLINSNNYSTAQIAKCLRVPAHKLAITNPNQSVKQLNDDYILNDLPYYFNAITSEFQLKLLEQKERKKFILNFDTRSVTGLMPEDVMRLYNGGLVTGDQALNLMGISASGDPDMQRRKFSLNYVWSDLAEKYQLDQNNKRKRKGDDYDEQSGDSSENDQTRIEKVGE
ncbi:bacteriophage portal protein [Enterococcus mundtii QU 25]|uniref:phage portal protein n=1 Tax=Enterococcus mundtii TaxID=53346 RepID=UPI0003C54A8B|nr:phage portal protein [Enterococcus mundtii]BAO06350.1 bacteriophage portal protein [Enterococcus mundtii QU 25]